MRQVLTFLLLTGLFGHGYSQSGGGTITWDEWGVPHIYAASELDLFYAEGHAQMQLHGDLILQLYGRSRGRAAEYWGKEKLPEDILLNTLGFPELAEEWTAKQDPAYKKLLEAFVQGMNDYATTHPDALKPESRIVLPVSVTDVNAHSIYVIFSRFVGGNELGASEQWKDMGSNTLAVAPSHSASGKAMLVQNPHLPWFGEFLFTEMHLNYPGHNIYGSTLVGFPGVAIAFNENLGWSHTNNTIDNADTYELTLKDGGYLIGDKRNEFTRRTKTVKYIDEQGKMAEQSIEILSTIHGPVVNMGKTKLLALHMVGQDRPNMGYQWWRMANAGNFEEFESALKMAQIPFWNVMYADKKGNIFYLFNGLVPKRSHGDWAYWDRVIPGGRQEDVWTTVHGYADLPKLKNPASGWLQNANDPPWSSTFPMVLKPAAYPAYMAPDYLSFRPQRAIRMMREDQKISFDELVSDKLSTRLEMADRILDDLFTAIDQHGTALAREAKTILGQWDRSADSASVGTLLFVRWAEKMNPYNEAMFLKKWSVADPLNTPDGLSDPAKAVRVLEEVAASIKSDFGTLAVPWGKACRIRYNQLDLAGNGADGAVGAFRVAWPMRVEKNISTIGGGDSWVGVIEFGEQVHAKVLLSYGNATQENSPHNGDQLFLFSKKQLRDAWFYKKDVDAHAKKTETLKHVDLK